MARIEKNQKTNLRIFNSLHEVVLFKNLIKIGLIETYFLKIFSFFLKKYIFEFFLKYFYRKIETKYSKGTSTPSGLSTVL
jgi:hypothetical protein